MIYLFVNLYITSILNIMDRFLLSSNTKYLFNFICVLLLSVLPGLQFEVGVDYNTYAEIFKAHGELFNENSEYFFYYLILLLSNLGFHYQSFFILISIINAIILITIIEKLADHDFDRWLIFLFVFSVTGVLHNQMNLIRNYSASFVFILAFIYRLEGKFLAVLLLSVLGMTMHNTFFLALTTLVIPQSYCNKKFYKNYIVGFLLTILFGLSELPIILALELFPQYSSYFTTNIHDIQIASFISKTLNIPIHVLFLFLIRDKIHNLNDFELKIIWFWSITSNLYILLIFYEPATRIYIYFQLLNTIPYYFLFKEIKKIPGKVILLLYALAPYLYKIVVFNSAEYSYKSIILQ